MLCPFSCERYDLLLRKFYNAIDSGSRKVPSRYIGKSPPSRKISWARELWWQKVLLTFSNSGLQSIFSVLILPFPKKQDVVSHLLLSFTLLRGNSCCVRIEWIFSGCFPCDGFKKYNRVASSDGAVPNNNTNKFMSCFTTTTVDVVSSLAISIAIYL